MRRTIGSVFAAAALAATGCNAELSPGATVIQSATATREAGSARVSYVAEFDAVSASDSVPLTGEGVFDYANDRGRMVFDMSGLLGGSGTAPEGADEVEMIVDDVVVYMKMPFVTRMLPNPRPWIKLDLEAAAAAGRSDLAQVTQLGQGDPTQMLELLQGVTKEVRDLGREDVRGAATTHYETVLDLNRAAEQTSDSVRQSIQHLIARAGRARIPADVWIDDDGRMRKLSYAVDLPTSGDDASPASLESMSVTLELYEFGIDVSVSVPSDDEVVDLLELSQEQQGQS